MKNIYCFVIVFFLNLPFFLGGAQASDQKEEWVKIKSRLEALYSQNTASDKKCEKGWNVLWPLAKKGSLEARRQLAIEWFYMGRRMPGHEDRVSSMRDFSVLVLHSAGAETDAKGDIVEEMYKNDLKIIYINEKERKCFSETPSKKCSDQAVLDKIIPSFDAFAFEIDVHVGAGQKSVCQGAMFGDETSQ